VTAATIVDQGTSLGKVKPHLMLDIGGQVRVHESHSLLQHSAPSCGCHLIYVCWSYLQGHMGLRVLWMVRAAVLLKLVISGWWQSLLLGLATTGVWQVRRVGLLLLLPLLIHSQ